MNRTEAAAAIERLLAQPWPSLVVNRARAQPDAIAVQLVDGEAFSYRRLVEQATGLACGLQRAGLHAGGRVGILSGNSSSTDSDSGETLETFSP